MDAQALLSMPCVTTLDATLTFRRPDVPPSAAVPGDPVTALRACHDARGPPLTAQTAGAGWLGERSNVVRVLDGAAA